MITNHPTCTAHWHIIIYLLEYSHSCVSSAQIWEKPTCPADQNGCSPSVQWTDFASKVSEKFSMKIKNENLNSNSVLEKEKIPENDSRRCRASLFEGQTCERTARENIQYNDLLTCSIFLTLSDLSSKLWWFFGYTVGIEKNYMREKDMYLYFVFLFEFVPDIYVK